MTLTLPDLAFYAGALLILFMTPGPVWLALLARSISGGFAAAWPLALGVAIGDMFWPLLAIGGLNWLVDVYGNAMELLRWIGCLLFLWMGFGLIRHAGAPIAENKRLTRPGMWAGFLAGMAAILGNPKAILFYLGVLPSIMDLNAVTRPDVAAIVALSVAVPLLGNLSFALLIGKLRSYLTSASALKRTNQVAGAMLMLVGLALPFT